MTVQERKFALTQENKIGEWIYEQLTTDLVAETQKDAIASQRCPFSAIS